MICCMTPYRNSATKQRKRIYEKRVGKTARILRLVYCPVMGANWVWVEIALKTWPRNTRIKYIPRNRRHEIQRCECLVRG